MAPRYEKSFTFRVDERQHDAIRLHCETLGVPVAQWLRILATQAVPPEHWKPMKPPPGQMSFEDDRPTTRRSGQSRSGSSSGSSSRSRSSGRST